MNLQSLGYKSQLIFLHFDGKVEDRGDYLVMRSLTNPNYFWGNLLVFDRAPRENDFEAWTKLFQREFTDPRIYHVTLAWDSPEKGDTSQFTKKDFLLEGNTVLSTKIVNPPPKFHPKLEVRPLESAKEWERMIEIQVSSAHDHLPRAEWESFHRAQAIRYQAMERSGFGHWFGGFLDGKLVTGLGIFHRDGLGRFQTVCTDPQYQRQGLCGTLVYLSSLFALQKMNVRELVMCADPEYHAIKIYESVGFQRRQIDHGVYWWDKNRI
jgi:ribosomal protein S18 acetylase RimI-like enzyme